MTRNEILSAIWQEFPKTVIGMGVLVYASLILLATQLGIVIRDANEARIARNELIASYDLEKQEEWDKADKAEAEALQWAKDCRAANIKGTVLPANSCDVIQNDVPQPIKEEPSFIKTATPEVVKVKTATYMNWHFNANGESQAPVYLSGDSIAARQNEMLAAFDFDKRYGLTDNYGAQMFRRVGPRHGINTSVLICIAKADTLLGQATKSSYNIGNVGNNDRGHVVHFKDIGAGIDAIGKVLNGRYLAHKQSLGSLTPFGGGSSPYYATSPTGNWYNNVRNCLAEILNDPSVGPDFLIRIK